MYHVFNTFRENKCLFFNVGVTKECFAGKIEIVKGMKGMKGERHEYIVEDISFAPVVM